MHTIGLVELRKHVGEVVSRVAYGRERIVLRRGKKALAVLVPLEDVAALEELEDRLDTAEARKVLARIKARKERAVPWEAAEKQLKAAKGTKRGV